MFHYQQKLWTSSPLNTCCRSRNFLVFTFRFLGDLRRGRYRARPFTHEGSEADPSPIEMNSLGPPPRLLSVVSLLSSFRSLSPFLWNGARLGENYEEESPFTTPLNEPNEPHEKMHNLT